MKALSRQVAVVTGAGSGIGKAVAMALAAQNTTLCLVGRRLETLEKVAHYAKSSTEQILCHQADLSLEEEISGLVARLRRDFHHVDILVHSAGVISLGPMERASVKDLDRQYAVNVRAPYLLTQALLPMLRSSRGQVVFMNSSAILNAKAEAGQYAATKHALKAIADSVREEVNASGVRVLTVLLGRTATPMQAALHDVEGKLYQPERLVQPEDVAAIVLAALSLPRTAEVTDISIRPMLKPASGSGQEEKS